mmetsp:Transcript_48272/g.124578  ORF Transcript_48272/g.124578 Transcript_48272/m.124578 type:complete len:141 (-) Transcript_48272:222-644(-)
MAARLIALLALPAAVVMASSACGDAGDMACKDMDAIYNNMVAEGQSLHLLQVAKKPMSKDTSKTAQHVDIKASLPTEDGHALLQDFAEEHQEEEALDGKGVTAKAREGCYGVSTSCFIDALCCSSRCITGTHRCGPPLRR